MPEKVPELSSRRELLLAEIVAKAKWCRDHATLLRGPTIQHEEAIDCGCVEK